MDIFIKEIEYSIKSAEGRLESDNIVRERLVADLTALDERIARNEAYVSEANSVLLTLKDLQKDVPDDTDYQPTNTKE